MKERLGFLLARAVDVTLYYACHLVAALLLALPLTALVAGTGITRFPEGDRLLFEPGALVLTEVLRLLAPFASSHASAAATGFAVLGMLLLLPHAALLVRLAEPGLERTRAWGRAAGHLPTLLLLSGAALLAQVLAVLGASMLGATAERAFSGTTSRTADLVYLAFLGAGGVLAVALGILRDLSRAALVLDSLDAKSALLAGISAFGRAKARTFARWAAPASIGVALVFSAAAVTQAVDVSRPGDWRVATVAFVHQLVAYALCWCRATWLASSLGLASCSRPAY